MATPRDSSLEAVAEWIRADEFARRMGIELIELRPGYSCMAMTLTADMLNFHGTPHGGAIFSLADSAFGAACNSRGRAAVALSVDIHYLSVASVGSRLIAEAVEESLSQRTGLYRITVKVEGGDLVASMHGMAYVKRAQ